jgi:aspartate dehydrogenase
MPARTVGLIGYGGIAQDAIAALRSESIRIVGVLARPGRANAARERLCGIEIVETLEELLARRPDMIAEVAGQDALAQYGETVLRSGCDLLVISVGALAQASLFDRLKAAAEAGGSRMALLYPQNANVAAAVALAGLGFEQTTVELVADPDAPGNVHEIEAEGAAGRFAIALTGKPSRTNPKTSALAALSVARALCNEHAAIVI